MKLPTSDKLTGRVVRRFALAGVLTIGTWGCNAPPMLGPPGTIGMQRSRAVLNDPYPNNELGPPIMGGRPPGFEQPTNNASSLQQNAYGRNGVGSRSVSNSGF